MTSSAISVSNLCKSYGSLRAVEDLTFSVARGEVFGLLGPNGAGKTTTVEVLEGYRKADSGDVQVLGLDPSVEGQLLRQQIGVMLQECGLYPGLKAYEVLRLFSSYYASARDPEALLDEVGLTRVRSSYVRRLSGGEKQRLSLACALIGRPQLLFLDEPTAGMDPIARAVTWDLIRGTVESGATVVLTTHLLEEAERLCDRVAIIANGKLAAIGTPKELTTNTERSDIRFSTRTTLDIDDLRLHLGLAQGAVIEESECEYRVFVRNTPDIFAALGVFLRSKNVEIESVDAGRQSLEEVFIQITAETSVEATP